jgi:glycosyltransferase involved in cell wall biosynthesis
LKILFITAWYPTKENPVSGIFIREHAKAVSLSGDEVIVIHSERAKTHIKGPYKFSETLEEGIRTIRISYFHSPFRSVNYLFYLWSILRISQKLMGTGFKPEVIHAHIYSAGVPAVIIGRLYGIPVVISEHWSGFPQKELTSIEKRMAKFAMNHAQWILPVSRSLQRGIEAYGIKGRFRIIPNVVDATLFYPKGKEERHACPKRILFVGSLKPVKGLPFLLHALARLRQTRDDWHLDIVGDGPARREYETMVEASRLSEKVIFHGMKSKQEVSEFMRKADLFVLPSLAETFGIVAAEALATGVPVLATRCGGPEEFITDEVGRVVSPGSVDTLCEGLNDMLSNLHLYSPDRITQWAYGIFSPEQIGLAIHSIYQTLKPQDRIKGF